MGNTNMSFMPVSMKVDNQAGVVGHKMNLSTKHLQSRPSKMSMGTNTKNNINIQEDLSDENLYDLDQAAKRSMANNSNLQSLMEDLPQSGEREKVLIKVKNFKHYDSHEEYSLLQSFWKNQDKAQDFKEGTDVSQNPLKILEKEDHELTMLNKMSSQEVNSQKELSPEAVSKQVVHIDSPKMQSSLDSGGKAKTLFRQSHFQNFNISPRQSAFEQDFENE